MVTEGLEGDHWEFVM
jgi:hypothetical protein